MSRTAWRSEEPTSAPAQRLETLADGVFAIVMTLLVLELSVPAITDASNAALTRALREMWPEFLIYGLSFLVLGMFWLMHKLIFDAIEVSDAPLTWLNVAFLLITALLPFSTALVGEFGSLRVAALAYGANVLLAFASAWALWAYATRDRRLTAPDLDPLLVRGANRMGLIYVIVLGGATALAVFAALVTYLTIGAIVGAFIFATMIGRWEAVTVWTVERDVAGTRRDTVSPL